MLISLFFQEGPGPEGHRGARVVWVCDGKYLLVSGFDRYCKCQRVFKQAGCWSTNEKVTGELVYSLFSFFYSRSERGLYLYSASSLSSGAISSVPVNVSPSTLIPYYDPDTSVVILTGKVSTQTEIFTLHSHCSMK